MDMNTLLIALPAITFAAVIGWAIYSRRRVEQLRHDPDAPKSSLAKDG